MGLRGPNIIDLSLYDIYIYIYIYIHTYVCITYNVFMVPGEDQREKLARQEDPAEASRYNIITYYYIVCY